MWIVKVLDIVDHKIENNETHLFNDGDKARKCFRSIVKEEQEYAEQEGYEIVCDNHTVFEMRDDYPQLERQMKNYAYVSIEEIKTED